MLLSINEEGLLKFIDGCTIPTNIALRVASVNPINELVAMGVDMEMHYAKSGLTSLAVDLTNNVLVYRLVAEKGWWYCPEGALASFPSITNVGYSKRILGIDLGELPEDEDLTLLKQALTECVENTLGVPPTSIMDAVQGTRYSISEAEHLAKLEQRKGLMVVTQTISAKLARKTEELNEANKTIKLLTDKLLASGPAA